MNFRVGDLVKLKDDLKIGELKKCCASIFTDARKVTWVGDATVEIDDGDLYHKEWLEFNDTPERIKDDMIGETIEIVHQLFKDNKISVGDYSSLCWSLRCEPQVSDEDETNRCNK